MLMRVDNNKYLRSIVVRGRALKKPPVSISQKILKAYGGLLRGRNCRRLKSISTGYTRTKFSKIYWLRRKGRAGRFVSRFFIKNCEWIGRFTDTKFLHWKYAQYRGGARRRARLAFYRVRSGLTRKKGGRLGKNLRSTRRKLLTPRRSPYRRFEIYRLFFTFKGLQRVSQVHRRKYLRGIYSSFSQFHKKVRCWRRSRLAVGRSSVRSRSINFQPRRQGSETGVRGRTWTNNRGRQSPFRRLPLIHQNTKYPRSKNGGGLLYRRNKSLRRRIFRKRRGYALGRKLLNKKRRIIRFRLLVRHRNAYNFTRRYRGRRFNYSGRYRGQQYSRRYRGRKQSWSQVSKIPHLVKRGGGWLVRIKKRGGRVLYRPLRLRDILPINSWWRTRRTVHRHHTNKSIYGHWFLRHKLRPRTQYDSLIVRKRRLYGYTKQVLTFIQWKTKSPVSLFRKHSLPTNKLHSLGDLRRHFSWTSRGFFFKSSGSNIRHAVVKNTQSLLCTNRSRIWQFSRRYVVAGSLPASINANLSDDELRIARPFIYRWNTLGARLMWRNWSVGDTYFQPFTGIIRPIWYKSTVRAGAFDSRLHGFARIYRQHNHR